MMVSSSSSDEMIRTGRSRVSGSRLRRRQELETVHAGDGGVDDEQVGPVVPGHLQAVAAAGRLDDDEDPPCAGNGR